MANPKHLEILRRGIESWNRWRRTNPHEQPDLSHTTLAGVDLSETFRVDLTNDLAPAASRPDRANLVDANLSGADLTDANLKGADLLWADLRGTCVKGANLKGADLTGAHLDGADLSGADLRLARLVETTIHGCDLSSAHIYGISAWDLKGTPKAQTNLVITSDDEPRLTVDDLKVAQFVYLLLENPNIREIIDTIGDKGVLILGPFGERKHVLDRLRIRLRELGFLPMVFDFEKPVSKDFTETVRTLAGMSAFIVADITAPKSVPQEAQATIPDYMIPFVPIIEAGERPWAMFKDLWVKYRDWVFEPLEYPSIDDLIPKLGSAVVKPALERRKVLLARRAEEMGTRSLDNFDPDEQPVSG